MNIRHGLALLAAAATLALVAGCSGDDKGSGGGKNNGGSSPKAGAATSAIDTLKASTKDLSTTSYKYSVKASDQTITGSTDPASGNMSFATSSDIEGTKMSIEMLRIGTDSYIKISGLPLPGLDGNKWLRIDSTKAKNLDNLGVGDAKDPMSAQAFGDAIVSAEKTGDRSYRGTVDLTKSTAFAPLDEDEVKILGDQAKAVPFEATVDDKGRLLTLKMSTPAVGNVKANTVEVTFSDYGSSLNLTKPAAGQVQDAPESLYAILNG